MPKKIIIDQKILKNAVSISFNINEVSGKLNLSPKVIRRALKEFQINTDHFLHTGRELNILNQKFGRLLVLKSCYTIPTTWLCKCDCGNEIIVRTSDLMSNHTSSCGCLKSEINREKAKAMIKVRRQFSPSEATAHRIWLTHYNDGNISFEKFKSLSQEKCYYCGNLPSNKSNAFIYVKNTSDFSKLNGEYVYNGLDRKNNKLSHFIDNVVPSCFSCNSAKSSMNIEDFKAHLQKILFNRKKYNNSFNNIDSSNIDILSIKLFKDLPTQKILPEIIGSVFGKLLVVQELPKIKKKSRGWIRVFLCKCICGDYKSIRYPDFKYGNTISCGKGTCRSNYDPIISAARLAYSNYSYKDGNLSFEEFYSISQTNCVYCNSPPSNRRKCKNIDKYFIFNGIDRIDSNTGYYKDNIVPACWNCNRMKSNYSLSEFNDWLDRINTHFLQTNKREKFLDSH